MIDVRECIQIAKDSGKACKDSISLLETLSDEEILNHKEATFWAYWYAYNITKGRWPDAEEFIKKNPKSAYVYALDVIKGRWLEAEEVIKTSSRYACYYALHVIRGKWPEAEEIINKSLVWAYWYNKFVL